MLQLKNETPFKAAIAVFPNAQGVDTLYVLTKATFTIEPKPSLSETQVAPILSDQFWGDPASSSIKYPAEMHMTKPATDVVLIGQAWAPEGRKVSELDVSVTVAERQKVVRAIGNRLWHNGGISRAEPFARMPMLYEYCYGGTHVLDPKAGHFLAEERNPVGRGFVGKRTAAEFNQQPLPNIEDPRQPIRQLGDAPKPACFAHVAPHWLPRRSHAGTYDQAWITHRAPYLPKDFNPRFFNSADPDLIFDRYLQGAEPVRIINANRNGPLEFQLPQCTLTMNAKVAGAMQPMQPVLETVVIEPEIQRLTLLWRGALPCDKKALQIEEVSIGLRQLLIEGRAV